jgi:hypothetical protein
LTRFAIGDIAAMEEAGNSQDQPISLPKILFIKSTTSKQLRWYCLRHWRYKSKHQFVMKLVQASIHAAKPSLAFILIVECQQPAISNYG